MSEPLTIKGVLKEVRKTHSVAMVSVRVWSNGRFGDDANPDDEVQIWDGESYHNGKTLEAAYAAYVLSQDLTATPAITTAEQALGLIKNTPQA